MTHVCCGSLCGSTGWSRSQQLLALGYTKREIQTLVAKGWLRRVYRGVYAVGMFPPSVKGQWMAAVLACAARDAGAVLSHAAAAALHDLRTVPGGDRCDRDRPA